MVTALSFHSICIGESCAVFQGDGRSPPSPTRSARLVSTFHPSLSLLDAALSVQLRQPSFLAGPWPCPWWLGEMGVPALPGPLCTPGTRHRWEQRAADNEQAIKQLWKRRHPVNAVCCSSSIFINSCIGSSELGSEMKVITILTQTLILLISF